MRRNFRESSFRHRDTLAEDVNPSGYIVNIADCMLVFACGLMIALITYWNIDMLPAEEIDGEKLEEINPEELPEDIMEGGSNYIEAGKVYQDPNTGTLYMIQENEQSEEIDEAQQKRDEEIINARSMGAD